ncbi:nuclear transport factor 2 family protein [Nonomuraea sp. KC401]|uniref:nuclear transport factor 2 family protein n=1 Tax=unclassified Nonomuraea TaxID=2593643 RepID=UPI0010FEFD33|nr:MULTISPECIES: nuclear transport factor 2 family protein [unclassified Nonomuraea]NBF00351.1 nuclear transport factor 2 family protein [Nonomuraea sp. K271]TLF50652.1 nuclear transport factor 2 family protein [Nonomuraea sp. KC401]
MSIEEIVTGYHAAMSHKSPDELADLYAERGLHEFPFGGLPPFRGREEVRTGYRGMWGRMPFAVREVRRRALLRTDDPEVVVVEQDTLVEAGEELVTVPGLLVLRIRDGEIVHTRDYMDTGAIARVESATCRETRKEADAPGTRVQPPLSEERA